MRSAKMGKVSRRGVAAGRAEGKSLCARLAPSSGAQARMVSRGANGVLEWTSMSVASGSEARGTKSWKEEG
jgi:hypothetical protein